MIIYKASSGGEVVQYDFTNDVISHFGETEIYSETIGVDAGWTKKTVTSVATVIGFEDTGDFWCELSADLLLAWSSEWGEWDDEHGIHYASRYESRTGVEISGSAVTEREYEWREAKAFNDTDPYQGGGTYEIARDTKIITAAGEWAHRSTNRPSWATEYGEHN